MDVRRIGHYDILQRLGVGGMGEVFLAEDSRLGRRIALKVLPEVMAAKPDRLERFETEARVVAGLNHPGIVTLHSLERHGDLSYLTMEFVDGDTLRRVMNERPPTVAEALAFVTEIAAALGTAHAQGITHRDVKPANIMRTQAGRAKILDFGLARLHEPPARPAEVDAPTVMKTQEGLLLGTIDYMAPEQALGRPVDPRSDVFSLGIVMYEFVSGKHPFPAESTNERLAAIIRDVPRPVERVRPEISGAFARAIDRCLCKDPDCRFQKGSELEDALRGAPVTLDNGAAGRFRSVAVLPFSDLSERRDQEYFCDGIAEEIADALNGLSGLRVASPISAARFRNETEDVRTIGESLGVESVIEGSLRLAGDRLRLSVRCTSAQDGYVVWSGRFDRVIKDVLEIQGDIASRVAQALGLEFLGDG